MRRLSSSVSTARLSVASNNIAVREAAVRKRKKEKNKKRTQTKGSGGADVSGARQVELRAPELVLRFFMNFQLIFTDRRRETRAGLPQNSSTCLSNLARQLILWKLNPTNPQVFTQVDMCSTRRCLEAAGVCLLR